MKIAVVGGGTAGFVAALILKTSFPQYKIDVIRSTKIGTIGVGEGSTEHWSGFMDFVGISASDIIKECDATFKAGIMFENWSEQPYLQGVHGPLVATHNNMPMVYAKLFSEKVNPRTLNGDYLWENKTPFMKFIEERPNETGVSQYHFNTHKLNDFMTNFALSKGCEVFDDEITDINLTPNGTIDTLQGENTLYDYDFYIDCTGFKRLLIDKVGAKWNSYGQYLKMKEAIVFPTPEEDEVPIWTLARAMNAGWMFRIPVYDRKGNGYIFDSDFITAEEAQQEVEEYLGHSVNVAKHIKFDPGAVDKPWIGNVCAIGLSASFVEPLEASSIGTSINQSLLLAQRLVNYNQESIDRYNLEINSIMDNIRDFICLHYVTDRRDTPFWKSVAETPLPESLQANLRMWKDRMPLEDDFTSNTKKVLFNEYNFAIVLYALGLFDLEKIKEQFDSLPPGAKEHCDRLCYEKFEFDKVKAIKHKLMLDLIKGVA